MAGEGAARSGDRPKRLLIVIDGDASNRYFTGILLQRLEYNIFTAKLAEEALEIMNITVPALVITESDLPNMTGLEFLQQIQKDPKIKQVPVIVYSVSTDESLKQAFLGQGAVSFLSKPVAPDVLYATVQKATETAPRKFIRLLVCIEAIVGNETLAGGVRTGEYITALSENGMYVYTPNPRMVGTRLPFTLLFPEGPVRVIGSVLYSFSRGQGPLRTPGMGVTFVSIRPEDQAMIREYIRRQVTRDIVPG